MKAIIGIINLFILVPVCSCEKNFRPFDGDPQKALAFIERGDSLPSHWPSLIIEHDDVEVVKILAHEKLIEPEDLFTQACLQYQDQAPIAVSALHLAAKAGAIKTIEYLLAEKFDAKAVTQCSQKEHDKQTPAHWALRSSRYNALEKLLPHTDIEAKDGLDKTIEEIAKEGGDTTALFLIRAAKEKWTKTLSLPC